MTSCERLGAALVATMAVAGAAVGCNSLASSNGAVPGGWDATPPPSADSSEEGLPLDASSCHAGSVQTFVPTAYRQAATAPGACSAGDIDRVFQSFQACQGSHGSPEACVAALEAQAPVEAGDPCAACILSLDSAQAYGPLIFWGGRVSGNVAGCLEVEDPSLVGCARAVQALGDCEAEACQENCPVGDSGSLAAYRACAAEADQAGCQAYAVTAECATAGEGGVSGAALACLTPSFEDFYKTVVPLFCGPAQSSIEGGSADAQADSDGAPSTLVEDGALGPDASGALDAEGQDGWSADAAGAEHPIDGSAEGSVDAGRAQEASDGQDALALDAGSADAGL